MQRKHFIRHSLLAGASVLSGAAVSAKANRKSAAGQPFNLNYGIHDGMFRNSAGNDFIDQIKFAYDQGFDKPRLVWQTDPPEDTIFQPLNIVYDLDGDGMQEVCVAAHYRVMIFEGTTGRKETELRYHQSRAYGWFGLADVDGDGDLAGSGEFREQDCEDCKNLNIPGSGKG